MAACAVRRLGLLAARRARGYGRHYSDIAPSRGPIYTTNLAEATVSLTSRRPLPVYRVMNAAGQLLDPEQDPAVRASGERERGREVCLLPQLPGETVVRMYEKMAGLCQLDQQLFKAQRMVRCH